VGAVAFFTAVMWTILSTRENPPENLEEFRRKKKDSQGVGHLVKEIVQALAEMPSTMKRLAVIQFVTWLGLFCMWLHFSYAVPVIYGSSDPETDLFKRGAEWAGACYAAKDAVTFIAAFVLMAAAKKMSRRNIHAVCLFLGGVGLLEVGFVHGEAHRYFILGALALGGVAWASILSMPYAILAGAIPASRMGVYMGIFNFFIVLPEIIASLFFGGLVKNYLDGNLVHAVMAGGFCLIFAAILTMILLPREKQMAAELSGQPAI
jgi:maltose/moltooligosaccharide transporter